MPGNSAFVTFFRKLGWRDPLNQKLVVSYVKPMQTSHFLSFQDIPVFQNDTLLAGGNEETISVDVGIPLYRQTL